MKMNGKKKKVLHNAVKYTKKKKKAELYTVEDGFYDM